jgi:hypothetical protein
MSLRERDDNDLSTVILNQLSEKVLRPTIETQIEARPKRDPLANSVEPAPVGAAAHGLIVNDTGFH